MSASAEGQESEALQVMSPNAGRLAWSPSIAATRPQIGASSFSPPLHTQKPQQGQPPTYSSQLSGGYHPQTLPGPYPAPKGQTAGYPAPQAWLGTWQVSDAKVIASFTGYRRG
eukprot:s19_g3.t1